MMKIGEVIRKYRKAKELTQEEMASRLGVTAPAVNKWENGNTMPDITLLAPIARLLGISLDELLSFQEELTAEEIQKLVQEADQKFSVESYDAVFAWAKKQIEKYPNCEALLYSLAMQLYAQRLIREIPENKKQDDFILSCYERLLQSHDEVMRTAAADALYGYYLRKEQYAKAEEYLTFFSMQNPERKRRQAVLYEKSGDLQKAYQTYEEILFADYQILSAVFNSLFHMQLQDQNLAKAQYYAEKRKDLARLFEMGEYPVYAADLEFHQAEQDREKTLACVQDMLSALDHIDAFSNTPLYAHMKFKSADPSFMETLKKNMSDELCSDESFAYMKGDPRWEELIGKE